MFTFIFANDNYITNEISKSIIFIFDGRNLDYFYDLIECRSDLAHAHNVRNQIHRVRDR